MINKQLFLGSVASLFFYLKIRCELISEIKMNYQNVLSIQFQFNKLHAMRLIKKNEN